ncbi:tetratricopeptide repeat-containing sensor histidine kinase [Taibaiella koreensis]|uniref:tetratricopeptide repeat-containing sensor histidine kinase n=1 Tax=Taibaiella koreensis TaxID=1268548 RepID=UPI0013C33D06|nr:tetratricopeptide repeat protein [Taibaiella koreensis]
MSCITGGAAAQDTKAISALVDSGAGLANSRPEAALILYRKAFDLSVHERRATEAMDAFSHIITLYNNAGRYDEALTEARRVQHLAASLRLYELSMAVYNSLANRFQRKGMYDSAMHYYYAAVTLAERHKVSNEAILPTLYANLSGVLDITGDDGKSIFYLRKAEAIARNINHEHLLALILINKGNSFANLGQIDSSTRDLKEALAIARRKHYLQWQHLALSNLAGNCNEQGQYREAIVYLEEALALKGAVDPNYKVTNLSLMGRAWMALGKDRLAEHYLLQSLEMAEAMNVVRGITQGHELLASLYARQGRFKEAYHHQGRYQLMKDSTEGKETRYNVNQLEVRYRTAQKDKEIVQKALQISRQKTQIKQRNLWILGISAGSVLLAVVAALLYSLYRSNWHQKRFQEEKLRSLEQEQEIGQLKAMMQGEEKERIRIAQDLHDGIGGMLASIKMNLNAIQEEQPEMRTLAGFDKVSGMLADTAGEVRKTAHNLMPDALTRQSLREALLLYCENNSSSQLQVDLQYDVAEACNKAAELFLYRIVQELVQNIVKHARASYAVIQLMLHGGRLSITVEDNGRGFDSDAPGRGAGLPNLKGRVETLQGYISIASRSGKGTTAHIEFDFSKLKNL